ncbi:MAG: helix-turn-helix transcriptional regulator [Lachnospiraceae bacterium]|nr:helix-turn-helix transcriptional regulator [Lachnospiraceae bacterium]
MNNMSAGIEVIIRSGGAKTLDEMEFFEQLKYLRVKAKLSQAALSKLTEIPKRTIEDWETGKFEPPVYVQKLLIEKLRFIKQL